MIEKSTARGRGVRQKDTHLAVVDLAQASVVLPGDADLCVPFLVKPLSSITSTGPTVLGVAEGANRCAATAWTSR